MGLERGVETEKESARESLVVLADKNRLRLKAFPTAVSLWPGHRTLILSLACCLGIEVTTRFTVRLILRVVAGMMFCCCVHMFACCASRFWH